MFVEAMIRLAPDVPTVTALAGQLSVRPSTLMSRFARAGLPSPKNYLAAIRLLHAAFLFETAGLSVADVAYRLEYSSPQSFGRHLRAMLGLTALEFRRRFPFPVALERFVALMMEPYKEIWRGFHPLAAGSWESGRGAPAAGRH
jgi:AraC-like DNA-binding protein